MDGLENMAFHLDERRLFVGIPTDMHEILYSRDTLFSIFKLCGDPKGGTTDELVVLDIDNAARDVSIDDVESEVKRFWAQTEGKMDLDEKVDETRAHVPPDFRLLVH